ncbi:MAG TPA: MFS transporter [Marmoricola sp.]
MSTAALTITDEQAPACTHFGLAVLALATGGFAIGTTEFVSMGLLPQIAHGVHESNPTTGHAISAYALGVVVGAPVLAYFGARFPRRALLIALMLAFVVGNAASAMAPGYGSLLGARFLAGVPHGAYFGVASLVAASLADPARRGRAVAMVMLGLSVANVVGVPAATWIGQHAGWRSAYVLVAALGLVTVAMIRAFIPRMPADPAATGRRELSLFAVPQVWLTLLVGAVGFGGMFAVYTYISPTITHVAGLSKDVVPVFLLCFGLGMVFGTWLAGELADWSIMRSLFVGSIGMGVVLVLFWLVSPHGWWGLPVVFGITTLGSVLVVNLQLRLMHVAGPAQTLGAAMNHASLNIGNAVGAWIGGIVVTATDGYRAPALAGAALSLAGLLVLVASAALHVRSGSKKSAAIRS